LPSNAEVLLDTSAALPFLLRGHAAHPSTHAALDGHRLGLAGHAAIETYSVITRLPGLERVSPAVAVQMLRHNFPHTVHLSAKRSASLLSTLASSTISGGASYDALVAAAAVEHGCVLATRDHRAVSTYKHFDVEVRLLA
jgi:predicted nucleic acid-binding protein